MKLISPALFVVLLLCGFLSGQTSAPVTQPQTFHIRGTITDPIEAVIPRVKVTFQGEQLSKTVTTNDVGVYEADLPLGGYTMTAQVPGFRLYRRPLFRETLPAILILNTTLLVGNPCGDMVVITRSGETTTDEWNAATEHCRREELIPIPSERGVPFELSIRYGARTAVGNVYSYGGEKTRQYESPVFMAYNVFSLQADRVVYDATNHTIQASGSVVAVVESGATQHADSMTFRMEDGRAIPVN